jgi:hypothetical protein
LKIFGVKRLHIIFVADISESEVIHYHRVLRLFNRNPKYYYNIDVVTIDTLFGSKGREYIYSLKRYFQHTVFIFDQIPYANIVANFRNLNIVISGGPVTKRQWLSPIQLRLATVITSLGIDCVESFHLENNKNSEDFIDNYLKINEDIINPSYNIEYKGINPWNSIKNNENITNNNNNTKSNTITIKNTKDFINHMIKREYHSSSTSYLLNKNISYTPKSFFKKDYLSSPLMFNPHSYSYSSLNNITKSYLNNIGSITYKRIYNSFSDSNKKI